MGILTFTLYYAHSKVIHERVQCIYQNEYLSCMHLNCADQRCNENTRFMHAEQCISLPWVGYSCNLY